MNSLPRWVIGLALASAAMANAVAFEGRVSLGIKSGRDKEQVINYAMKEGLVRMEFSSGDGEGAAMIMNWAKQEMIMLMVEEKMYMVMPLKQVTQAVGERSTGSDPKIEKTGKTDTVLGYLCEEYRSTEGGETTEMWVTDQLGAFMGLSGGNPLEDMMGSSSGKSAQASGWERALKGQTAAFPLRVVNRDAKGREIFRLEVKKIEKGPLPDSLFVPPAGFKRMNLPMMGGFGGQVRRALNKGKMEGQAA